MLTLAVEFLACGDRSVARAAPLLPFSRLQVRNGTHYINTNSLANNRLKNIIVVLTGEAFRYRDHLGTVSACQACTCP